jgi:hypothetical protein
MWHCCGAGLMTRSSTRTKAGNICPCATYVRIRRVIKRIAEEGASLWPRASPWGYS